MNYTLLFGAFGVVAIIISTCPSRAGTNVRQDPGATCSPPSPCTAYADGMTGPGVAAPGAREIARLNYLSSASEPEAAAYNLLYSFSPGTDGNEPISNLTNVNGTLYGTTQYGGGTNCTLNGGQGCGTVFEVSETGIETVIYRFQGGSDGAVPASDLINVNGTLYGTTLFGGGGGCVPGGCGTVFSVTTSGAEQVIYGFGTGGGRDGYSPKSGLVKVDGALYGTTQTGGSTFNGTIFSLAPPAAGQNRWNETIVYNFQGSPDGAVPRGNLLNVGGTLYGTTYEGGSSTRCSGNCGTVFAASTSGAESVIHSFGSGTDGSQPLSGLINVNGALYGTTSFGGPSDNGTVFNVTTSGGESPIYQFKGGTAGGFPVGDLANVNGTLYGTALDGGMNGGIVYKVSTSGSERLLHSFGRIGDGFGPYGGLLNVKGTLYGTTISGGANTCIGGSTCGIIFALKP